MKPVGIDRTGRGLLRRRFLGFVFQGFNSTARTSAVENLERRLTYGDISHRERREKALMALVHVGLRARAHHQPSELTGGQQQRVAIARPP
ncbi:ATP-binding cassette domain-containing protein [Microvirga makkahensis]|uniref:ATP-binding cassette domain-containing protein n=1 Tax=Microvirga makkahensis TaxID=1128670 RepID=A0A7X3SN68_9HYPH|nr:ATP-binding cassette domain-containing protein [Microvirga makkahensis]MXQ11087.1 ATP-binding cassette domain-containing protein [Microvirga makkahensis]